ncbi:MAG: MATE family efflux transporter, partial [Phycisphaerales bacterium]|nr:MATE family efflux transporter [Phycisphaerales bacterium]
MAMSHWLPVSARHHLGGELAALFQMGGPLIAAQLAQMATGFFDTVMMGRVGSTELAAVAIGTGLWHALFLLSLGILMGVSPSVAQCHGAGRTTMIAPLVRQALWLGMLLGIVCFVILRQMEGWLVWLGIESAIVPVTGSYLRALSWGMPAIFLCMSLRLFSEGIGRTRPVFLVSVLGLVVNIVANYVLIFGHWGFPALGALGCGIATALAMWVMLLGMLFLVRMDSAYHGYGLFQQWVWPRWQELRPLLILGLPIGVSLFLESAIFATVALLLGRLGA